MVFTSTEAATQAHKTCVAAFNGNLEFAGFKIRPPINTPDWMMPGHQPCQPWLVLEHRCIIFGIAELAKNSVHFPNGLVEFFIHNDPPIILGNHARNFCLTTLRNTQVPKQALAEYLYPATEVTTRNADVIPFPVQVAA